MPLGAAYWRELLLQSGYFRHVIQNNGVPPDGTSLPSLLRIDHSFACGKDDRDECLIQRANVMAFCRVVGSKPSLTIVDLGQLNHSPIHPAYVVGVHPLDAIEHGAPRLAQRGYESRRANHLRQAARLSAWCNSPHVRVART